MLTIISLQKMRVLISAGICCCLQQFLSECSQAFRKILGPTIYTKFMYFITFLSFITTTFFLVFLLQHFIFFQTYLLPQCDELHPNCLFETTVYRQSIGLLLLMLLMIMIAIGCSQRVSLIINDGLFLSKYMLMVLLFISTLRIDPAWICAVVSIFKYGAYIYLLYQSIVIIDLCYLWGIKWAKKYQQNQPCAQTALILVTIIIFSFAITFNVVAYISIQCQIWPSIIASCLIPLLVCLQFLNFNKQNSLLSTSVVCALISYYGLSADYSFGDCRASKQQESIFYYIDIVCQLALVCMCSYGSVFGIKFKQQTQEVLELQQTSQIPVQYAYALGNQRSTRSNKQSYLGFYCLVAMVGLCYPMVITGWEGQSNSPSDLLVSKILGLGSFSVFYAWTLLAPRLCPNRNFEFS